MIDISITILYKYCFKLITNKLLSGNFKCRADGLQLTIYLWTFTSIREVSLMLVNVRDAKR